MISKLAKNHIGHDHTDTRETISATGHIGHRTETGNVLHVHCISFLHAAEVYVFQL